MSLRRMDVQRVKAFGNKTVFVPTGGPGESGGLAAQAGNALAVGFAAGMGADQAKAGRA